MSNFSAVRKAARELSLLSGALRSDAILKFSQLISENAASLIEASKEDLSEHGAALSAASRQRLVLSDEKIEQIAAGVKQVAALLDPIGVVQQRTELDSGLDLERIAVPIGVFGVIFESRADVAPQILSLALRSANAVILKGGSESKRVNTRWSDLACQLSTLPKNWFQMHHERSIVDTMLAARGEIDLIIPRGSNELVRSISERSTVPVLGHADGVCHLFIDRSADLELALKVVIDSKVQYPAACNALETLLVDAPIAESFLPLFIKRAKELGIELRGSQDLRKYLPNAPIIEGDAWHIEYGDLILALKVVPDLNSAIEHINHYGSQHTDGIIAGDAEAISRFSREVDSANVYSNCSTRFADGFRYGFGAEIGISTGRIHARGPVGIEGLLTYKYLLHGSGQIVADYSGANAKKFTHRKK